MNNEEIELLANSKYRQFINAVDKALKNFEYSSEWADLISSLGKLNKVLQSHLKFKVVPRKIIIAKRLSQCTHPALPSGVHLKAMETYELIFRRLGKKGLAQDLFIYSSGLFPLLGNCAMSVKPVLMGIYEEFFVSLGKALIPCLPGLLLGILPGIEEGSEYTNRTLSLLESTSQSTDMATFYGTLWTCMLSTASIRLPAVTFIMSRLNKKAALNQDYILGDNIHMMVQSVCVALADSNVLVQRSLLDFLLTFLPMNCELISRQDKVKVAAAGLSALLRRDMSLNRRLYSWLLGPENKTIPTHSRSDSVSSLDEEENVKYTYFYLHSKSSTVKAIIQLFKSHYSSSSLVSSFNSNKGPQKNEALGPFKIVISLLDRPEIGNAILEDVLIEVFRVLYFRCKVDKEKALGSGDFERKNSDDNFETDDEIPADYSTRSKMSDELIKTANLLFNALEPCFMWEYVCKLLSASKVRQDQSCATDSENSKENASSSDGKNEKEDLNVPSATFSEVLRLTDFLLDIVALEADIETQTEHWPKLLRHITKEMTSRCQSLGLNEISEGICLCSKLLSKVMPSMKTVERSRNESSLCVTENPGDYDLECGGKVTSPRDSTKHQSFSGDSSSESRTEELNEANFRDESTSSSTDTSDYSKASQARVVQIARVSNGEDELSGWSVVDLRKRLETRANDQTLDAESELTGSGETLDRDDDDGVGGLKVEEKTHKTTKQELNNKDIDDQNKDVEKEATAEDDYDEWMDCQDTSDINGDGEESAENAQEQCGADVTPSNGHAPSPNLFQPSLIQSCVDYFQSFFSEFVTQRIISSSSYGKTDAPNSSNSEHILDELLSKEFKKHVECSDPAANSELAKPGSERGCAMRLPWETHNTLLCAEAFAAACRLLVELSCFPVYCSNDAMYGDDNQTDGNVSHRLPEWLQALIVCCFRVSNFDIQSSAVGTLLDLLNLTLSVAPLASGARPKMTVVVVVIPMISHANLNSIEQSCIYKVIAESLWRRVRHDSSRYHQRIVELFLQLHSLTPRPSLCEDVITNSLINRVKESRLEGHWKFAVFWHAARNVVVQDSGRTSRLGDVRPLDRALFIMLDGLESDDPEIRVLTKQWLAHGLQHGDLGRLVDPLLVLLLHPATARLSIHHACALERNIKAKARNIAEDVTASPSRSDLPHKNVRWSNSRESIPDDPRSLGTSGSEIERTSDSDYDDESESGGKRLTTRKGILYSLKRPNNSTVNNTRRKASVVKLLVHPLDQHKLLYRMICDSRLTLYAFNTLLSILRSAPHQFVCAAASFSISSSSTPHQDKIKGLLARHRKSLLGKGFYGPLYDTPGTPTGKHSARMIAGPLLYLRPNTSKYLEILISISLYFIRSEYPASLDLEADDVDGNTQVQMTSADVLTSIIWQLVEVVRENAVGIGPFISDLFARCKVQKALLHCLLSTLYERTGFRKPSAGDSSEVLPCRISTEAKPAQLRAFQVKLIKLLQAIIVLEDNIDTVDPGVVDQLQASFPAQSSRGQSEPSVPASPVYRYLPGRGLAFQSMLLSAVVHGLQNDDYDLHHEWLRFVIACLPHMRSALGTWVEVVVEQVGRMLQKQIGLYVPISQQRTEIPSSSNNPTQSPNASLPPDYVLSLLEHLGTICHFCLVDTMPSSPGLSLKPRSAPFPATTGQPSTSDSNQVGNSGQIFVNLLHAFSSQSSPVNLVTNTEGPKPYLEARERLLSILPSVLTALISVWSTWNPDRQENGQRLPTESFLDLIGSPKSVRLQMLQLLTPVVMNHTIIFLASLADVWHQRGKRSRQSSSKSTGPVVTRATDEQAAIVDIVYALKALSFDNTIDTVKLIVRQVVTSKDKSTATQSGLEVHILQFFYHYIQKSSHKQLVNARPALISLMKEGLQLNQPPALFLLLVILQSYVQRLPLQEDKKAKKELQDITQRLIEACNTVAGSSLENAAWFRRNIAVIPQIDTSTPSTDQFSATESEVDDSEPTLEPLSLPSRSMSSSSSHYSTQALSVMSEVLAPLLDVVFGSEEKDRVTSLLTTVMYNVTPYLKNHGPSNVPNFRACCAVVASLSGYQYMRRAWKKDVMEQVMDPSFFQMDISCIGSWRTIIDNLMTQDSTSFKDLMARVAGFSQSASINIFANREQEMEQRAHLLKKLAFVIFCSEVDQYQYCLPEIQERLAECLRLPQAPVLHEQVFLALRVLLLRMSPQHLTSLWPVIISEVVHVLLQLESDLSSDDKTQNQRMLMSETLLGTNGCYANYSQEKWLCLYLSACKLLDLTLSLPGDRLPQFQMYRWAFEGGEPYCSAAMVTRSSGSSENKTERVTIFKPHTSRLWKLLKKRTRRPEDLPDLQRTTGNPLLTMYHIKTLDQLLPFFKCLCKPKPAEMDSEEFKTKMGGQGVVLFERIVERDFLESLIVD